MKKNTTTREGIIGEASRSNLNLFWLVDISGSMMGSKIEAVNRAIREVLPDLRRLENAARRKVFLSTIKFGSRADWHGGEEPVELSKFTWNNLAAIENDVTSTAQAIELLCSGLDTLATKKIGPRSVPPACILLSDGHCTDPEEEYNKAIEKRDLHPWGVKATRISIGIGSDYNKKQLDQFISPYLRSAPHNLETLPATSPKKLVRFIRTSSTLAATGNRNITPNPRSLPRLSYLVCVALDTLHAAGWAYCDISTDNIVFDTQNVRISIWDNDNVVVNNTDVGVEGTLDFMAPEVRFGESKPNAEADLYSVAVLLYQMWMWEHPMDGKNTFEINPWDDLALDEYYLRKPVFAFHPSDMSNTARGVDMLELTVERWDKLCPPVLKEAFIQSFTAGVYEPGERIRLGDWKRLFLSLEANAYLCPGCGAYNLVDGTVSELECFNCGAVLPLSLVLHNRQLGSEAQLIVHKGALLRGHHLGSADYVTEADKIAGEVEDHPRSRGAHALRNRTQETWQYNTPSAQFTIEPGKARALVPDSQLTIGGSTIFIERFPK